LQNQFKMRNLTGYARATNAAEVAVLTLAVLLTVASAIFIKEQGAAPALVQLASVESPRNVEAAPTQGAPIETIDDTHPEMDVRWFNGKMVRPARTIMMKVTAYSPDHRSCGVFADGQTATLHSVFTNGMKLVAADTRVLPFGSMITVSGYDSDNIVPVLDRGGAIKGNRLDLMFPPHESALVWGVRTLPVTVWEYADGSPIDNPRELR